MKHTHLVSAAVLPGGLKEKEDDDAQKGERGSYPKSFEDGGIAVAEHWYQNEVEKRDYGEDEESIYSVGHRDFDSADFGSQFECC